MANDLDLGDLTITISTFDDKPHEAVFTLPDGSTVARHFQHNGELKMRLGLGLGLLHASLVEAIALPYVEPEETPDAPPGDSPTVLTPPNDTPTDPDTSEPEPGIDPTFSEPTRIEITDQKQTVIRTAADPGTWGNAYVAAELDGYDYWEIHVAGSTPKSATLAIGVTNTSLPLNGIPGDLAGTVAYWSSGAVRNNGSDTTGFSTFGKGDKISIARDKDTGRIWFAKNGTWLGSTPAVSGSGHQGTLITSGPYYPFIALYSGSTQASFKFISSKFTYSAPSGFYPIGKTPPINSVLPVISGTATSGETLSTTNGTWSGSPTSYAYQWKADGVAISGATAATFDLTDTQIGSVITVTVTATNAAGSTSATSEGTDEVAAAVDLSNGFKGGAYSTNGSFSGVALGAADAARQIIVAISWTDGTALQTAAPCTAVTIGGVSATLLFRSTAVSTYRNVEFWAADVPNGSTGDVVCTIANANIVRWSCAAYAFYDLNSTTPTATLAPSSGLTSVGNMTVPADGYCIAASSEPSSLVSREFTNMTAVQHGNNGMSSFWAAHGFKHSVAGETLNPTVTSGQSSTIRMAAIVVT